MDNYIFDSHAHYDDPRFDDDRDELLSSMSSYDVGLIMNIGADLATSKKSIELTNKYNFIYSSVGIHPEAALEVDEYAIAELYDLYSSNEKVKAIGEIGLDYHYDEPTKDFQIKAFINQLDLARELAAPVIIHNRDAHEDTMNILRNYKDLSGVVHCFSGSVEMAKELLKMDFYLSFNGILTFSNAKKAIEVLKIVPMDKLLIETDCPYLAPTPYRGKRNSSAYLPEVIKKISEVKNISEEEVIKATTLNAKILYNI